MLFVSQRKGAKYLCIYFSVLLNFVLVAYPHRQWYELVNSVVKVKHSVQHINKHQVSVRRTAGSQVAAGHLKLGQKLT